MPAMHAHKVRSLTVFEDSLFNAQFLRFVGRFTAPEGAAGHCESLGRSTFNMRAFDWLDQILFGRDSRVA
jgi:hypothetical protein